MAERIPGFSRQVADILAQMGVTPQVRAGMAAQLASPVWGETRPGIVPQEYLNDLPANQPSVQAARKSGVLDPSVVKLLDEVRRKRAEEAARGGPSTAPRKGFLSRVLDILGRPGQAVESALFGAGGRAVATQAVAPLAQGGSLPAAALSGTVRAAAEIPRQAGAIAASAGRGLAGRERHSGAEILPGPKWARVAGGLGMDIGLDPLSYLGVGLGKAAATAPGKVAAAERAVAEVASKAPKVDAAKLAKALSADVPASRALLTPSAKAARTAAGATAVDRAAAEVGKAAARTARATLADDLVKVGMKPHRAKAAAIQWLTPGVQALDPKVLATRETWLKKILASPDTAKGPHLDMHVSDVARQAEQDAARQLAEVLHANLAQGVKRSVKLTAAGVPIGKVPIPRHVAEALGRVARAPLAAKAVDAFGRAFDTGSRFDRELTLAKARSAGLAERRIEIGRRTLHAAFAGTTADQRRGLMESLAAGPGGGHGVLVRGGSDLADTVGQVLDHAGRYVDWEGDGSGLLRWADINRELPRRFKTEHDLPKAKVSTDPTANMLGLVKENAARLRGQDSAAWSYALYIAVEKAVARDQLGRALATFGVPLRLRTTLDPASGKVLGEQATGAGRELVDRFGYAPIVTRGLDRTLSPAYSQHLEGLVFDPETKRGIERVMQIADNPSDRGDLLRFYDSVLSKTKRFLTLPSPAFHLRNSFGDMWLGYADDVKGPRGLRSYDQAARVLARLRGEKGAAVRQALSEGVDPATGVPADPLQILQTLAKGSRESKAGAELMKTPRAWSDAPGGHLSAEQVWAAYSHAGLNRGYVAADLERALGVGPGPARALGAVSDKLGDVSQLRENYFRLAHFIDRLKRSKASSFATAAEEAAGYVRKFHFDYHDVTPTEAAVFSRIMPFYKWQRFALPLVLQMFFARPGKILNAQKGLYAASDLAGYSRDNSGLPTADEVLPGYFRDAMMIPLYSSIRGATVYANPGLPGTQVPLQTLGLSGPTAGGVAANAGKNLVSSVNPWITAPFELATGTRTFGGVPTGPLPQYLLSKSPLTALPGKLAGQTGDTALRAYLSGLGLQENTPSRQRGALMEELRQISENRKKAGYQAPKRTGPSDRRGTSTRRDTRGG